MNVVLRMSLLHEYPLHKTGESVIIIPLNQILIHKICHRLDKLESTTLTGRKGVKVTALCTNVMFEYLQQINYIGIKKGSLYTQSKINTSTTIDDTKTAMLHQKCLQACRDCTLLSAAMAHYQKCFLFQSLNKNEFTWFLKMFRTPGFDTSLLPAVTLPVAPFFQGVKE